MSVAVIWVLVVKKESGHLGTGKGKKEPRLVALHKKQNAGSWYSSLSLACKEKSVDEVSVCSRLVNPGLSLLLLLLTHKAIWDYVLSRIGKGFLGSNLTYNSA